ncbi:MAG: hypothetical protein AAB316_14725 [Bacteroidota bacterium]
MSGQKKTPIQILREDLDVARKQICDLSAQRKNMTDELQRAREEGKAQVANLQTQMEKRRQEQAKVVENLQSDIKEVAAQHHRDMAAHREEFVREMLSLETRTDQKYESLRDWTHNRLEHQRAEHNRLALRQQRQNRELKRQIEQIQQREETRSAKAKDYVSDLQRLVESAEQNLPHEKFAPGKMEKIRRQLAAAERQWQEDLPATAAATAQQALFDLMDLEEEVMKKELDFELLHGAAIECTSGLFEAVRRNRMVEVQSGAAGQEVNFWTEGRYDKMELEIAEVKQRLETEKNTLDADEIQSMLIRLDEMAGRQESLIKEAVERIISSQLRAEMGDSVVDTLNKQGFRMVLDDCGYFEQDQRKAFTVNMQNRSGTKIVTVISPDEKTYENIMSVNTYDEHIYDENVLTTRSEEILSALRGAGLQTGATICSEQGAPEFYEPKKFLQKKESESRKSEQALPSGTSGRERQAVLQE